MLTLASASPRRAELLRAAAIPFDTLSVDIDESPLEDEPPEAHVRRLAEDKARAGARLRPSGMVLAADTVVAVDGRILGKPIDSADAARMLRALSGRAHDVVTGVALVAPAPRGGAAAAAAGQGAEAGASRSLVVDVARTRVWFFPLAEREISRYIATGEPMDKAGAYAIQGVGARFVERIDGSYSNVVGLPVALVYRLLRELPEIWQIAAR